MWGLLCGAPCGPSTVSAQTSATLQAVNGVLNLGTPSALGDPNVQQLTWQVPAPRTNYFPTVRVDYIPTQNKRFYVAWNETKTLDAGVNAPNLPGKAFANTGAGNKFLNYTAAFAFDWTLSPTMVNAFRGGFLYNFSDFGFDGKVPASGQAQIAWNVPNLAAFPGAGNPSTEGMNGTNFQIPTGSYYPLFNASDTLSWCSTARTTLNFGFSWWREQNHYYNGVLGYPGIQLGSNSWYDRFCRRRSSSQRLHIWAQRHVAQRRHDCPIRGRIAIRDSGREDQRRWRTVSLQSINKPICPLVGSVQPG